MLFKKQNKIKKKVFFHHSYAHISVTRSTWYRLQVMSLDAQNKNMYININQIHLFSVYFVSTTDKQNPLLG